MVPDKKVINPINRTPYGWVNRAVIEGGINTTDQEKWV